MQKQNTKNTKLFVNRFNERTIFLDEHAALSHVKRLGTNDRQISFNIFPQCENRLS